MQPSISYPTREPATPNEPPVTSRLRTVTGNKFPRKCACGCGLGIPRDPEIRYVVDFGTTKPYPAYLREHSPDYGSYRGRSRAHEDVDAVPGFTPASELLARSAPAPQPREASPPPTDVAHSEADASPTPEAGRAWAFGQLVFNAGQFESARSGFADYAKDGETGEQLRVRVNRILLEDLEQKVLVLRALHAKLRERDEGPSFSAVVSRSRPRSEML
jgi:hypothetical protein